MSSDRKIFQLEIWYGTRVLGNGGFKKKRDVEHDLVQHQEDNNNETDDDNNPEEKDEIVESLVDEINPIEVETEIDAPDEVETALQTNEVRAFTAGAEELAIITQDKNMW